MRFLAAIALLTGLPAAAVEGGASVEITVGGKQFALNADVDFSPVEDRLLFTLGYGLLKSPDVPATDTVPRITTSATHLISGGIHFSPHRSWMLSLNAQGSPRAYESVPLNPDAALADRITLSTTRQSAGASLGVSFDTAGHKDFEWGVDASGGFTWNRYRIALSRGAFVRLLEQALEQPNDLFEVRPELGLTALLFQRVTLSVRGSYTWFSQDPLLAGTPDLNLDELPPETRALLEKRLGLAQTAVGTVLGNFAAFDAIGGYPSAPVVFRLKSAVQVEFSHTVAMQLSWAYMRYWPGEGFGNVLALRATFHLGESWIIWAIGSAQLDALTDQPASKADYAATGFLSIGAEFDFRTSPDKSLDVD